MAQPIRKFQAGQVSAAIWENTASVKEKTVSVLKASVQRRFMDKDGQWKPTVSFGRNEIPLAMYCLEKCFEHIIQHSQESTDVGNGEGVI